MNNAKWFLMRVAYGQEKKVGNYLYEKGVEVFHPTWFKERTYGGQKKRVEVSIIPNALFVHSTMEILNLYVGKEPTPYLHYYYTKNHDSQGRRIGNGIKPIIIPDNQMETFMLWVKIDSNDKLFLNTNDFKFKTDDIVRVIHGPFKGLVGKVVRLKGQTRVGINLDNIGFISTAYIPKRFLEKTSINL